MSDSKSEQARLLTLDSYAIMDTAAEKAFDDVTRLISEICDVPISLVSLIDDERQWFKSSINIDVKETAKDIAFCTRAIESDDLLIVEDAAQDSRFKDNPLVTEYPHIRFYAGAPLIMANEQRIGTLCVIDTKPRELNVLQINALQTLRDAVVAHIELRRSLDALLALKNLLPMCAWCQSVKAEGSDQVWQPLKDYVSSISPITHSICPSCQAKLNEESGS